MASFGRPYHPWEKSPHDKMDAIRKPESSSLCSARHTESRLVEEAASSF